jgi:adenylate cyclase
MVQGLRDKEKLRHTFGLHVGRQTAEQILRRDPGLSGVEETVTVMFVDIRNFTARCRTSDPARIVSVLNLFLTHMVRVVEEKHGGMINKFLGDGFMALFGAGGSLEEHADAALTAAEDLLQEIDVVNEALVARGEEPLQIGIGLHTGPAIVGSIGSPERLEFTAIGDTVNMASRVEGLTKIAGASILLTAEVKAALKKRMNLKSLPAQSVKGVEQPVPLYTVE